VRHDLDPVQAIETYDYTLLDSAVQTDNTLTNTLKALAQLEFNRQTDSSENEDVDLSDAQVHDIVSFLLSLTDPCVTDSVCLAPWLPSGADPDGLQLRAVDRDGRSLAP
jgi:cytochrome c peroxidase